MGRGLVQRAFQRISRAGLGKVDRTAARYVQGSNQYLLIGVTTALPFEAFFLFFDGGRLWQAALVEGAVIAIWLGCFALNVAGWSRTSSIIELAAPLMAFAALTWLLSYRAGFLLPMLLTASVSYVTFVPKRLVWGLGFTVASAIAVAWSYVDPRFAEPRLDASADLIDGLVVGNVVLVTLLMGLTSGLNHHYFSRERIRAERQLEAAEVQARTDPLTRLANRLGMVEALAATPDGTPYAVALIDLDRFKEVNDALGHAQGDTVLTEVAGILKKAIGEEGIVARWGGEEFLVFMIDTHLSEAVACMERARVEVEAFVWPEVDRSLVTFSAGLVAAAPGLSWEAAVRAADILLYEAKDSGRNCVRYAEAPAGTSARAASSKGGEARGWLA